MNSSLPALNQCSPVCPSGEPCPASQPESSEADPNRAALLGHGGRRAPDSLTDFTVTGTVESATTRAQTLRVDIKDLPAVSKGCEDLNQQEASNLELNAGRKRHHTSQEPTDYDSEAPLKRMRHTDTSFISTLRTETVESATTRAQTNLTNHFQTLCTNDDGASVERLLSRISEKKISRWLDTPLHFSEFNDTPMMYVARHNCVSIASLLLRQNANPVKSSSYTETGSHPLFIAAQENQVEVIHVMSTAKDFDPDTPRSDGHNALSIAILKENQEAVKALLECNANPNYKIPAVYFNGKLHSVESLPQNAAACADRCWLTMINSAARKGSTEILRLLLSYRGNPNNVDPDNPLQQSPLVAALLGNTREEVIQLLLEYGADMHEHFFVSPRDWADIYKEKINKRATVCQYICATMSGHENESLLEVMHNYYRTRDGKQISFKKFYEENSIEGYCRLLATSDVFFDRHIPLIHDLLPNFISFSQKKITEFQISSSGVDEKQAKVLENLSEEKTREAISQLKNTAPKEIQELLLQYLDKLENDGNTLAQDYDKNRALVNEFLKEGVAG